MTILLPKKGIGMQPKMQLKAFTPLATYLRVCFSAATLLTRREALKRAADIAKNEALRFEEELGQANFARRK
ncbi:hypothetical protein HY214_01710 [Candidatus Roizmanbacteria bacterium]|nr:hypothetical protein [Candidatus Roizmanbacteria bacterium]